MSFGFGIGDIIKVLELAKGLRDRYKDAPDHLDSLSREIVSIHSVLENIDRVKHRLGSYEIKALEAPINECRKQLGEIQKIYDAGEGTGQQSVTWKDRLKRLKFSSDNVQELRLRVSLNVQMLNAIRQHGDSEAIQAVRGKVDTIREEQTGRKRKEILEWLHVSTGDYEPQHRRHMEVREHGTGRWLLNSEEFQTWTSERGKGLLCPGDPGSGKTIMTSIIIEELYRQFPDENTAIAYIFCNAKDQSKQTFHHISSSLAKQLAQVSLPEKLVSSYEEHQKKGISRSERETLSLLHELIATRTRVFVLIDALDECSTDVRQKLLSELFKIQCDGEANIFATTREIPEIVSDPGLGRCGSLRIRADKDDVLRFVISQLPRMQPFVQKRPEIQTQIKDVVSIKADGMFLLASLIMDFLKRKQRPKDILNALNDLPTAYESYYDEAWKRIKGQDPDEADLATKVISWVVCARQPLRIADLQYALASENEWQIDEDSVFPEEAITSVCAGLVRLSERKTIWLVHQTTQEYFEGKRDWLFPNMDAAIATACIRYLFLLETMGVGIEYWDEDEIFARPFASAHRFTPFSHYALSHWVEHARRAQLVSSGLRITKTPKDSHGLDLRRCGYELVRHPEVQGHMATLIEVLDILQNHLLPNDESAGDGSSQDSKRLKGSDFIRYSEDFISRVKTEHRSSTRILELPVYWAAWGGHLDLAKLFLNSPPLADKLKFPKEHRSSRDPYEVDDGSIQAAFRRAVTTAVELGSIPMIDLFLDFCARAKVHVEVEGDMRQPLLCVAMQRQSEILSACRALLRFDEVPMPGKTDDWSLSGYARKINERPLSPYDVKINKRGPRTTYPVMDAIVCADHEVLRMLLERGVDIEVRDSRGRTPFLYCVENGGAGALEMLRRFGADLEATNDDGKKSLHLAVQRADVDVVRCLLDFNRPATQAASDGRTLDIEARDSRGNTALHYSVSCKTVDILQILLDDGANPEAKDNTGQTLLFTAAETGNPEVLRHLLTQVVSGHIVLDIEARDDEGKTALWHNAFCGNIVILQVLLEYGADPEAKNEAGRTVLFAAAEGGRHEVVHYLLGVCGMDANPRDTAGKMPIEAAAQALSTGKLTFLTWDSRREADYLKTIKRFLEELEGDDVKTAHQAIIFQAVRAEMESLVELLVEQKQQVDCNWRDERGMTPLMHAVQNESFFMTKQLLDWGAELEGTEAAIEVLPTGSKRCKVLGRWYYYRGEKWVGS